MATPARATMNASILRTLPLSSSCDRGASLREPVVHTFGEIICWWGKLRPRPSWRPSGPPAARSSPPSVSPSASRTWAARSPRSMRTSTHRSFSWSSSKAPLSSPQPYRSHRHTYQAKQHEIEHVDEQAGVDLARGQAADQVDAAVERRHLDERLQDRRIKRDRKERCREKEHRLQGQLDDLVV